MMNEKDIQNIIESFQGSNKTFSEFIAEVFKNKLVEIYTGDNYEEISTEQITTAYPEVICGKILGAYKDCLVLSCTYREPLNSKKNIKFQDLKFGKILFLQEFSIKSINEIDGVAIFQDLLLTSKDSLEVKALNDKIKKI